MFTLLEGADWIPPPLAARLRDLAAFRSLLVHCYVQVDLAILEENVGDRLEDLLEFAAAVRGRLSTGS
jgi:uncharacterized protein YutE (UPF0331/DUF86 family)